MRLGLSLGGRRLPGGSAAPPPPPPPPPPPASTLFGAGQKGFQFDPSDFSSMTIARDGSGPAPAIGDVVGRITDLSGNGHEAVAYSDASRPRLELIGGKPALRFDGVDDAMVISSMTAGPSWSFFVAMEQFGTGVMLGRQGSGTEVGVIARFRPFIANRPFLQNGSTIYVASTADGSMAGEIWADGPDLGMTFDGASPSSKTAAAPVVTATTELVLGDRDVPARDPVDCALFGLVAYTEAPPTDQQRQDAMAWLRTRQGSST